MIKLVVTNEKNLELYELEKVHVGENKFGYYLIFLPEVLNGYNLSECEVKLIQIFEDNTSVAIDVDTTQETRPIKEFITLDATAQAQTITLSVLITHKGDVIGKTNQKTYQVYPTKNATPIDPREELDKIIADLREEKAELEFRVQDLQHVVENRDEIIAEKNSEIRAKDNEINSLLIQADENEQTIERQETTIDQLNSRIPPLETLEPITPIVETRTFRPQGENVGFNPFTILAVTSDIDRNIQPENIVQGKTILGVPGNAGTNLSDYFNRQLAGHITIDVQHTGIVQSNMLRDQSLIESVSILNANKISESAFNNCTRLENVQFPQTLVQIDNNAFKNTALRHIVLPSSCRRLGNYVFASNVPHIVELNDGIEMISYSFHGDNGLTTINLPASIITLSGNMGGNRLEFVTMENGFNCNELNLSASTRYSHDTILSWFNALADRTGQTAYTLTIGTANLNKMTAEEKAIAINKNWNLA